MHSELLHLDERLVVLAKPPGLSLATPRSDPGAAVERLRASLAPAARRALAESPLWLVHRLDVGTSGLVLLARDADTHRALVRALSERRIQKTYLALVWGAPRPRSGRFEQPLGPDRADRRRMRVEPGGRAAITVYRVLGRAPHLALVELSPETGRTHQIRVHLAAAGHPIIGDDLYGGPRHHGVREAVLRHALSVDHPLLHAWRLGLRLPGDERERRFEAALPRDFRAALTACGLVEALALADAPIAAEREAVKRSG